VRSVGCRQASSGWPTQNIRFGKATPNHASLRFKPIKGHADLWSVRIGDHYRGVGYHERAKLFIWTWIGSHEEYNKLIKR